MSPKRGAGAEAGVGMLRGGGDSLTLKHNIGSLVSWFLRFKVSEFQRFTKSSNVLWNISIPYDQTFISCFLEDIDPIFKIFKKI